MQYSEIPPSPHLAGYIKCFWSMQAPRGASDKAEPVVPDGCLEVVFNLADRFQRFHASDVVETQPVTIIAGQMRKSVSIRPTGRVSLFGIRFRHAGAFPFFPFSLSELTDRIENIDSVWGTGGKEIEDRILSSGTFGLRVRTMETILTARLTANKRLDDPIYPAICLIGDANGSMPIRKVAEICGINERRLERTFLEKIGLAPKLFSRIVRFQKLLRSLEGGGTAGLLDKALGFGYYDHAHMVHEFNEFTGKSLTAFVKDAHRISEAFTAS